MDSFNEQRMLKKAQAFDLTTLGQIYDQYSPGLYRYAYRLLANEDIAEECVADTFSRYLFALKTGNGPTEYLKAYLYRIAHNWITDSFRRKTPIFMDIEASGHLASSQRLEEDVITNLDKKQVLAEIRSLTPDQRQVIVLRFIEGWTNPEIARAIQKPVGAVKALQHRALGTLKNRLLPKEERRK